MSIKLKNLLLETTTYNNYIHQYNQILSDKTGMPLYGSQKIFDYISKPSGMYLGYKYYVGDSGKSVRYNFKDNQLDSVDVFFNYSQSPTYTVVMDLNNPEETIDAVSNLIIPQQSYGLEKAIKTTVKKESLTSKYGGFNIKKFMSSVQRPSSIYEWLKATAVTFRDEKTLSYLSQKDYTNLFRLYIEWCKKNAKAIKGLKAYTSYASFFNKMRYAYDNSGVVTQMKMTKSLIKKSEPEKVMIDSQENELFEKVKKKFKLTPNQTYDSLNRNVKSVLAGINNSLIVCGSPGAGKSYNIEQQLIKSGFQKKEVRIDELQAIANAIQEGDIETLNSIKESSKNSYMYVSGASTPFGVYSTMYMGNGGLILFDDCDKGIFDDPLGVNIIKAATDSKKIRTISYVTKNTLRKGSLLPPQFDFNGKVIFVTNLDISKIDSAIVSRANIVNFDFTYQESLSVINKILPYLCKDTPGATMKIKKEVLDYLKSLGKMLERIDLRTFSDCIKTRLSVKNGNWKKICGNQIYMKQQSY